jgi:hypothetical protein
MKKHPKSTKAKAVSKPVVGDHHAATAPSGPVSCSAPRFEIHCRYVMAWLVSTKTFDTREEATRELRKWKEQAKKDGYGMSGGVVEVQNTEL